MQFFYFSYLMLKRDIGKNALLFSYYLFLVFILSSVIFTANSLQYTFLQGVKNQDDIVVSFEVAGRNSAITEDKIEKIELIDGIKKINKRVYGFYDAYLGGNKISINGIDFYDADTASSIAPLVENFDLKDFLSKPNMLVSDAVKALFERQYYQDKFVFENQQGHFTKVSLYRTFKPGIELFLNDTILIDIELAQSLLGYASDEYTDVTLSVPNPYEVDNIIEKLHVFGLSGRSKKRAISDAMDLYEYKGGLFLCLYLMAFLGFMMIFYIQASVQGGAQKKQVGILRAIGWSISDIIRWRLCTALLISISAFVLGVTCAYLYVFLVNDNVFLGIFMGTENLNNDFVLLAHVSIENIFLLALLLIVPFIGSTLYPAWKVAVHSPSEAMK
ncbi:hypothetical protein PCNPT3_12115 [Psychromonas sp. CNPT3]|uniref:ABC transporter permease n=1 Tax=Psychromonas sp. CNPT3 TaxID=314282 RepID=UPI00006E9E4B|nr:FtsX-like permease family protein [Psychromonas sp. CNPT3]AGH82359.1 hypothetical protein PCNPT3_12115 [Psychromonas sp. CNPT3]